MNRKTGLIITIVVAVFLGFFVYPSLFNKGANKINSLLGLNDSSFKIPHFFNVPSFRLGLDLQGGTHLVYEADLSTIDENERDSAMNGVRDVIERRVNLFGVAEPVVQIEGNNRLIVELAGVSDINEAIKIIGETPFLEFKEQRSYEEGNKILKKHLGDEIGQITAENFCTHVNEEALSVFLLQYREDPCFVSSGFTGRHISKAIVIFADRIGSAGVSLSMTNEGTKLFADITKKNINKYIAIYLDGLPISIPVVNSEIKDGSAEISGNFTTKSAKELATRLNAGALPVSINRIEQQNIGASLGRDSLSKSLKAGLVGLIAVAVFMIIYYRLPGVLSVIALFIYVIFVLTIYKIMPVTMTLAGLAGFILSLGIAVDANVLIFARMREELKDGRKLSVAVNEGFNRAWYSIRDGHVTTLLGAFILYVFTSSVVKGFALTLGIGVLISLFTSVVVTRSLLGLFVGPKFESKKWMF